MAYNLTDETRKQIFHLLVEGNGIRSIRRIVGASTNTIMKFQTEIYNKIIEINTCVSNLHCPQIEADEVKTYVDSRWQSEQKVGGGWCWIFIALDRTSRMIVDFHVGKRDANSARDFIDKVSARLNKTTSISTDCLKSYVSAVQKTGSNIFADDEQWPRSYYVDLVRARALFPTEKYGRAITNRVESQNGLLRQHVSRLTRNTRCISKSREKLEEHITLYFFYYNFIKIHRSIKTCPAVQLGIIDKPLTINELVRRG